MQDTSLKNAEPRARRLPPTPIMQGALLCTILQAAAMVGRGERWVYEAMADGRIAGVKSDGRTLIVIKSVHDYVSSLPPARVKATPRHSKAMGRRRFA